MARTKDQRKIRTERRTLAPANITFAGENVWEVGMKEWFLDELIF